jgi:RimJ/RimL family protein N-acetyltransferase
MAGRRARDARGLRVGAVVACCMQVVETARLLVRPWRSEDDAAPGLDAVYLDPVVRQFTGGVLNEEDRATFIARRLARQERKEYSLEPVIEKASGEIVGVCGLQPLEGGPDIEVGWMLARAHWGKGFATEAAAAVLRHAHEERGLPLILCTIDLRNAPSVAVANRLGLRFDRVRRVYHRDMLVYESRA